MMDDNSININFEGGFGGEPIPGINSEAMFPGSAGPIPGLDSIKAMDQADAFEESVPVLGNIEIPQGELESEGNFLTASGGEETFTRTMSKSSAKETDSLTGEVIEESDVASATLRERPGIQARKTAKNRQLANSSFSIENFFDSGYFVVGETGKVRVNNLYDGSRLKGEVAIFSLEGIDEKTLTNRSKFIKEASRRALTNSQLGHTIIADRSTGVRFPSKHNRTKSLEPQTFEMKPGDKFGMLLVPNGTVREVFDNPKIGGKKKPIFSLFGKDKGKNFSRNVIAEVIEDSGIFGLENSGNNKKKSNFKDTVFQLEGAESVVDPIDKLIGPKFKWVSRNLGKKLNKYFDSQLPTIGSQELKVVEGVEGEGREVLLEEVINPRKNRLDEPLADELINYGKRNQSKEFEVMSDRLYSPAEDISVWGYFQAASQIEKIDLQVQKEGGSWQDISDITEFEKHPIDGSLVRFDYDLKEKLKPGKYQLKASGTDSEGRAIETVEGNFTVLSLPEDYVLSNPVKAALEEAIDLSSERSGVLAETGEWVVSVKAGTSPDKLAAEVGADNLGSTGHIPNTYVFKFPATLEGLEVAEKLDLTAVEFAIASASGNLGLLGIPKGPQLEKEWHLQNTGQSGGTPEIDLNVAEVWDEYRGKGVVIAAVDDGLDTEHPDLKERYEKDLSWDFNEGDPDPSHNSKVVFERDRFLNFLEKDEAGRYFETPQDWDGFLEETVTDDKISFVLPTSLTGLLDKVNLNLTVPDGESLPEDLQMYFYAPNNAPENPGSHYWSGSSYYYGWIRWPGWDDLESRPSVVLDLSDEERDAEGNSIYNFEIDKFEDRQAGGYWSLEIVDVDGNYSKKELEGIAEQIRKSWDWTLEVNAENPHGTAVAGIAAASSNENKGVSGVAPEASLAGLRLIGDVAPVREANGQTIADALFDEERNGEIDIFNNSWAPEYFRRQPLVLNALEAGFSRGRDGLGNNFVFAAGNDGATGGNVNYNYLANSRHTIAVGAVDYNGNHSSYSTPGASVLVSALSNNENAPGIATTDLTGSSGYEKGSYNNSFGGTSAAAPQVAGTIALMLEANPLLTARDVQHILVETASRDGLDNTDAGWSGDADAPLRHSHNYGFGLVDAKAAVEAAETWKSVGGEFSPEDILEFNLIPTVGEIPDNDAKGVSDAVEVQEEVEIEWVEVELDATHSYRSDLEVVLVHTYTDAETGEEKTTESVLANRNSWSGENYDKWTFASARHWGETSAGTWELRVSDLNPRESKNTAGGTWHSWKLNIYGDK